MRGGLTDSCCRLSTFGLYGALSLGGPFPHRSTPPAPEFHVPFYDLGGGIACADYRFGAGAQPTHTRATTAWTRLSTGLWIEVPSGSLRSYYNEDGVYCGALFEHASINQCKWNRDLTNVLWVKAGAPVVAKDGAGMDGVANSCSTITCGAAGDTVIQTVAFGTSVNRQCSLWLKRISGTGTIEITEDGVTWTDITSELSSSHFRFIAPVSVPRMSYSLGVRMTTPGDVIAVDMGQVNNSNYGNGTWIMETPIPTEAVAVTRNADALGNYNSANIDNTVGSCYAETSTFFNSTSRMRSIVHVAAGSTTASAMFMAAGQAATHVSIHDGTNAAYSPPVADSLLNRPDRFATSWGANGKFAVTRAGVSTDDSSFDGSLGTNSGVFISRGTHAFCGCIKELRIWKQQLDINVVTAVVNRGGR